MCLNTKTIQHNNRCKHTYTKPILITAKSLNNLTNYRYFWFVVIPLETAILKWCLHFLKFLFCHTMASFHLKIWCSYHTYIFLTSAFFHIKFERAAVISCIFIHSNYTFFKNHRSVMLKNIKKRLRLWKSK